MSHEFESGLFIGEPAWHGLGTTIEEDSPIRFDIHECLQTSGLDWKVEKRPLFCRNPLWKPGSKLPKGLKAPAYAVCREDKRGTEEGILGVVGEQYTPLQNEEQFQWFHPFLATKECSIETCGSLKEGAVVWVLARIQREDAVIVKDSKTPDTVRKYLLLTSSHDGSRATQVGFTPIRVVCWNTLSFVTGVGKKGQPAEGGKLLKIKHTKRQGEALKEIRKTINLIDQEFEATAAQFRKLAKCKVSRADLRKYVKLVLEAPEKDAEIGTRMQTKISEIVQLAITGTGSAMSEGTVWGAYNGVTEYLSYAYGRNQDSRLRSLWYGEAARVNKRALNLALELAG